MAKTLDTIVVDTLGLKEMTICRLLWEIDALKEQLAALQAKASAAPPSSGEPTYGD